MTFQTPPASPKSTSTHITTPEQDAQDNEEIWASDSPDEPTRLENPAHDTRMMSDLPSLRRQHMTDGYREGLSLGKAQIMQQGFDQGYPIGVTIALRAGKVLGALEGMLLAKGVEDNLRMELRNTYDQAKRDLAIGGMLEGVNDELIMNDKTLLDGFDAVVSKWEHVVFGQA